jgi:hypothetical protein
MGIRLPGAIATNLILLAGNADKPLLHEGQELRAAHECRGKRLQVRISQQWSRNKFLGDKTCH